MIFKNKNIPDNLKLFIGELDETFLFKGGLQFFSDEEILKHWTSKIAFHKHYKNVLSGDIPFACDYFGDLFFLRDDTVYKLYAEDGEIEPFDLTIENWFNLVLKDPEDFLNISFDYSVQKGSLLMAYPPFCFEESSNSKISEVPFEELILFHIELYKKVRELKNGEKLEFIVKD